MNSFSLISFLLVFTVLRLSHCNLYYDRILHASWEPRGSLACFKTATLDLFQNLKKVIDQTCIQDGETEFRSNIIVRAKSLAFIMKNGPHKVQFEEGMKQAEKMGTEVINRIKLCLTEYCSDVKQEKVEHFVKIFRKSSAGCGNSNYLSSAMTALEQTCMNAKEKSTSNGLQFFFHGTEDSYNHDTQNPWNRDTRLHIE